MVHGDGRFSLSGRVPWDSALTIAFGILARILLERQELGTMLGAAARIFLAISEADSNVSSFDRLSSWPGYGQMSVGLGFLRSAWIWLPELLGGLRCRGGVLWGVHALCIRGVPQGCR